jgi:hypothetical protein
MAQQVFLVEYFPIVHGRTRGQGYWITDVDPLGMINPIPSRRPGLTTAGVRRFATSEEAVAAGDGLLASGTASAYRVQEWVLAG